MNPLLRFVFLLCAWLALPSLAALVNCPECGRRVSNEASQCPNCGLPGAKLKEAVPVPSRPSPAPFESPAAPQVRSERRDPPNWFDTADSGLDCPQLKWNPVSGTLDTTPDGLVFKSTRPDSAGLQLSLTPPGLQGTLLVQVLATGAGSATVKYSLDSGRGITYSYSTLTVTPGTSQTLYFYPRAKSECQVTFTPTSGGGFTLARVRGFWFPSGDGVSSGYTTPSPLTLPEKPRPTREASVQSTVLIVETDQGAGSGFLARSGTETYIFSNQHVMGGAKSMTFRTADGRKFTPVSMEVADKEDLVRFALSAEDALTLKSALTLAAGEPRNGESIMVYGNSQGTSTITELPGEVESVGPNLIEVSAPFVQGNSGGPICNRKGEVLGVSSFVKRAATVSWVEADSPFLRNRRFGYRITPRTQWIKVTPQAFMGQARTEEDIRNFLSVLALSLDHIRVVNYGGVGSSAPFLDARYLKAQGDATFHEARWSQMLENFSQRFAFVEGKADRRLNPSEIQRHVTNLRQEYVRLTDLAAAEATRTKWLGGFLVERAKESAQLAAAIKIHVNGALGGK